MAKIRQRKPAAPGDGWTDRDYAPAPGSCKECGVAIPRTRKRGSAFGGYGRARELCSARCRKRWSRAHGVGITG